MMNEISGSREKGLSARNSAGRRRTRAFAFGIFIIAAFATAQSETAESFLQKARATRDSIPPLAYDFVTQTKARSNDREYSGGLMFTANYQTQGAHRTDQKRIDTVAETRQLNAEGMETDFLGFRRIWNGERFFIRNATGTSPVNCAVSSKDTSYDRTTVEPKYGAFLEGFFQHAEEGQDWISLFQDSGSARLAGTEFINNRLCRIVSAETELGNFKFWVDEERGFSVLQAEVKVEPEHIAWGEPLGKRLVGNRSDIAYAGIELAIRDVTVEQVGDYFVSTGGTLVQTRRYTDRTFWETTETVRRSNLQLDPDFELMGAFKMDFPEGAFVTDMDTQLIYKFNEGHLIPQIPISIGKAIDEAAAAIANESAASAEFVVPELAGDRSGNETGRSSNLLIAAIVVAGLIFAGCTAWALSRRWKNSIKDSGA